MMYLKWILPDTGTKHAPEPCCEVEALENIGCEGPIYLHQIVKYYDSLGLTALNIHANGRGLLSCPGG